MTKSSQNTVETETQNIINIKHPSEAYNDAINSVVYRLSELMFGSLLAAYVLGFLSFASATADPTKDIIRNLPDFYSVVELIIVRAPYLFISITYAYITAGAYVTYHGGILTMPFMQLEKLSIDFLLALSQAVFFGISMLYPIFFPFCLGFTLIISAIRQTYGYTQVTTFFYDSYSTLERNSATYDEDRRKALKEFRKKFRQIIKSYEMFSSWQRMPKTVLWTGIVLILLTPGIWWILRNSTEENHNISVLIKNRYVFWVSLVISASTAWYVHKVIGKRASFLHKKATAIKNNSSDLAGTENKAKPRIDERFDALVGVLKSKIIEYENEENGR